MMNLNLIINDPFKWIIPLLMLVTTSALMSMPSLSSTRPSSDVPRTFLFQNHKTLKINRASLLEHSNSKDDNIFDTIESKSMQSKAVQRVGTFIMSTAISCLFLVNPCLPAHAQVNDNSLLPGLSVKSTSISSSVILSTDAVSPSPWFSLGQSPAFQSLPREPPMQQAERQLRRIADLQDAKLAQCIDRGPYWEQCFMYGMRDDANGIDYQWGSPEAALELKPSPKPSPFAIGSNTDNDKKLANPRPPTW